MFDFENYRVKLDPAHYGVFPSGERYKLRTIRGETFKIPESKHSPNFDAYPVHVIGNAMNSMGNDGNYRFENTSMEEGVWLFIDPTQQKLKKGNSYLVKLADRCTYTIKRYKRIKGVDCFHSINPDFPQKYEIDKVIGRVVMIGRPAQGYAPDKPIGFPVSCDI